MHGVEETDLTVVVGMHVQPEAEAITQPVDAGIYIHGLVVAISGLTVVGAPVEVGVWTRPTTAEGA